MALLLLSSPFLILAIHAVFSRSMSARSRQMIAVYAVLAGYAPMVLLLWFVVLSSGSPAENAMTMIYCFIVYTALGYTYFHFYNTSETARRVRLLYEIYKAGSLSSVEIAKLYKTADIINLRLQRLVDMGQLTYRDGRYFMRGRILFYAAMLMSAWQKLLGFR